MPAPTASTAASIAVVPLRQPPEDPEHARFASAFFEDVIAELASFPQLEVLGARTCLGLSEQQLAPATLAERFGVTHVLDSTITAREGALEIKASILEAPSGRQIWSTKHSVPFARAEAGPSELAAHVANHLNARIHMTRLAQAKQRPLTALPAYDLWLRGRDALRRGTIEADAEARELFERALAIDPTYARGYVGLSLSHFNEWSCQLWQAWEENERLAYEYAQRALDLDESDAVAHSLVGRILMYRRSFARARHHLERAIALSPNDADLLAHSSMWMGFLGDVDVAIDMSQKAFRLNPLHDESYFVVGAMPYFFARRLEDGLRLIERAPTSLIVDQSAYMAASYAHLGDLGNAKRHVGLFLETFQEKITFGRKPELDEPLAYLLHVNPFAREEDAAYMVEGLKKAGLGGEARSSGVSFEPVYLPARGEERGVFKLEGEHWTLAYAGRSAQVKDMKGLHDIALLLASPGERVHCMELAGRMLEADSGPTMDAKARAACQRRMRELREELDEAEALNDLGRREALNDELEALTDQLAAALGLAGKSRKLGDPAEKARTAVTWRVRSAIKKLAESHPELGKHLESAIRTGAFCAYAPERSVRWG